ncbi:MAG: tetratricopeptide repeat protein [Thermodesulfovibrionales bacterium]|nr:tetratricopeptide repeat protein [Thermodesulfovibrionales bacterium]
MQEIQKLIKEAESLRDRCLYDESLKLFKRAYLISKKKANLNILVDLQLAIADIYRIKGNFEYALSQYTEVVEICDALDLQQPLADAKVGIALSLRAQGHWNEAIKNIKPAKSFYLKNNDKKGLAFSLWAEGGILRVKGDIKGAIEKFKESLNIFTSINFKLGIGYSLCGLGGANRMIGNNSESMQYYKKANEIFNKINDKFGTAYSFCGIGNAYRMQGDLAIAIDYFLKASALYKDFNDIVSHSYTIWSMANVMKMENNFSEAERFLDWANKNFKKTKDNRGISYCLMCKGEIEYMKGNHKKAQKLLKEAFRITESYRFALEMCHAKALLYLINPKLNSTYSGYIKCYKKIGLKDYPRTIPFNMP